MKLSSLAKKTGLECTGDADVIGIAHDTRTVRPGYIFACLVGANVDGHTLAMDAVARGAIAALVQSDHKHLIPGAVPMIVAENTRKSLPALAAELYGQPSQSLTMIGVTGTNGKTTSTHMIASILRAADKKVGTIGTLGIDLDGETIPSDRTTPEVRNAA